jgi:hypothetical protein
MTTKQIPLDTVLTFNNLSQIKSEYGSQAVTEFCELKKEMLVQQGAVSQGNFASSPLTTSNRKIKGIAH